MATARRAPLSLVAQELRQTRLSLLGKYPGDEGLARVESLAKMEEIITASQSRVHSAGPAPGGGCWLWVASQRGAGQIFLWSSAKSGCEWQCKHPSMCGSYFTDNAESCNDLRERLAKFAKDDFFAIVERDRERSEAEAAEKRAAEGCCASDC
jgi:hypothetical protein